jgi:hypothetical protein
MNIKEHIDELLKELRPDPPRVKFHPGKTKVIEMDESKSEFWYFENGIVYPGRFFGTDEDIRKWRHSLYASTDRHAVINYAFYFQTLRLYQLLAQKNRKGPIETYNYMYGTDFFQEPTDTWTAAHIERNKGQTMFRKAMRQCVLGNAWFADEHKRLEALKICKIDATFQKECGGFGLA